MITYQHERHILGSVIASNGAVLSDLIAWGVAEEHFTNAHHRALWAMVSDRHDRGEPVEALFLAQAIHQTEDPRKYGPASLVTDLVPWQTPHLEHEAKELIGHHCLRRIREHGERCVRATGGHIPEGRAWAFAQGILERVETAVGELDTTTASSEETGAQMADALLTDLEASKDPKTAPRPISTSIIGIDGFWRAEDDHRTPAGLVPGELGVVAGRPGMGKTALAENLCISTARQGHGVAIASCDMGRPQLRGRLLAKLAREVADPNESSPPVGHLISREAMAGLSPDHRVLARRAAVELVDLPLRINRLQRPTIRQIRSYARNKANELRRQGTPLRLLVVDYLDKIKGDHADGDRRLQIGVICNQLKDLAEELGCTVLLLVQINRSADLNPGGRPATRNLKESGDIEQAADWIFLLWRESEYIELKPKDEITVIVAKNRRGRAGREVTLNWHGPTGTIADPPYRTAYQPNNVRRMPDPHDRADDWRI